MSIDLGHLVVTREAGGKVYVTVPPCPDETLVEVELLEINSMRKARIRLSAPRYVEFVRDDAKEARKQ